MSKTNFEFLDALGQIARDKGISVETLFDALANALVAAYKRRPGAAEEAVVTIDPESGEIRVYGQELDEDGNVIREWDDTPSDFGRIAAQTAKQVILQRIREAERDLKYEEYAGREGDIVTGIVQQTDNRYTLLDLGKVEALLPQAEQVPYERYEHGARLKAYIVEVRKTTKGPQIVVSRSHPGLVKRLFELEVPEISSGVVEIKAAAREPGHRTKIAVWSNDPNVDPVGRLRGRPWFAGADGHQRAARGADRRRPLLRRSGRVHPGRTAAGPRAVRSGSTTRRERRPWSCSDYQLSLAIGKEGQNARLSARLSGWRVDIKSETQLAEEESRYGEEWAEGEWVRERGRGDGLAAGRRAARRYRPPNGHGSSPAERRSRAVRAGRSDVRRPERDIRRRRRPPETCGPTSRRGPRPRRVRHSGAPHVHRLPAGGVDRTAGAGGERSRRRSAPGRRPAGAGRMVVLSHAVVRGAGGDGGRPSVGLCGRRSPRRRFSGCRRSFWRSLRREVEAPRCARMVARADWPVRAHMRKKDRRSRCRRRSASTSLPASSA